MKSIFQVNKQAIDDLLFVSGWTPLQLFDWFTSTIRDQVNEMWPCHVHKINERSLFSHSVQYSNDKDYCPPESYEDRYLIHDIWSCIYFYDPEYYKNNAKDVWIRAVRDKKFRRKLISFLSRWIGKNYGQSDYSN